MYPRCFEIRGRRLPRSLLLGLAMGLAACGAQAPRPQTGSVADVGRGIAPVAPSVPASVQIDEGVGFTVTEAVSLSAAVRTTYREALQRLAGGDNAGGIELLRQVVEQAPDTTGPYVDLGIALGHAGRDAEAVDALEAAVASTPDHPVALNELGIAYRRLGRFGNARRSYERALDVFPEFHFARRNLAVLCDLYLADVSCAVAQYEIYRAAVPEDADVTMWLTDLRNRSAVGGPGGGE